MLSLCRVANDLPSIPSAGAFRCSYRHRICCLLSGGGGGGWAATDTARAAMLNLQHSCDIPRPLLVFLLREARTWNCHRGDDIVKIYKDKSKATAVKAETKRPFDTSHISALNLLDRVARSQNITAGRRSMGRCLEPENIFFPLHFSWTG